ncbi:MAG: protein translocase subunit SecF [Candidatus Syntropharchaeia archaeon]
MERIMEKIDITRYSNKQLLVLPLVVLFIALLILLFTHLTTGSPVKLGIDFEGGTLITIRTHETPDELFKKFSDYPIVGVTYSGDIKQLRFGPMSDLEREKLWDQIRKDYGDAEKKHMSPIVSKDLQFQAVRAVGIAFILMAIVVFIVFRTFVPSFAVVLSAFSDIVVAAACMDISGMELSLGTVAALLMLIGYSVDSDILLTTRLLKRTGEINKKLRDAMKTGITMTSTTICAMFALYIISSYFYLISTYIPVSLLKDISAIILFGLFVDLINTWMLNAGILRWYTESKEKKKEPSKKAGKRGGKKQGGKR